MKEIAKLLRYGPYGQREKEIKERAKELNELVFDYYPDTQCKRLIKSGRSTRSLWTVIR